MNEDDVMYYVSESDFDDFIKAMPSDNWYDRTADPDEFLRLRSKIESQVMTRESMTQLGWW